MQYLKNILRLAISFSLLIFSSSCSDDKRESALSEKTLIVPTMDTPIEPEHNIVWSGPITIAWRTLMDDVYGSPIILSPTEITADRLNVAPDIRSDILENSYIACAGKVSDGVIDTINSEFETKFPDQEKPVFDVSPSDIIAYSYLSVSVVYGYSFQQNPNPFGFTNSAGEKKSVRSFGLGFSGITNEQTLSQVGYYAFRNGMGYVVDLDISSSPYQVLLCKCELQDTIENTLEMIEINMSTTVEELHDEDTLIVPEIIFQDEHIYEELLGKFVLNAGYEDYYIRDAKQKTQFCLDKNGASVSSEAQIVQTFSEKKYLIFNNPFLVIMKKRGSNLPFFVMWVDNAQFMKRF